ncbi:MAG: hypothetical protein J6S74_01445 [Alphaproteobacteria bacterium]|nr:hypothetical protein [Alphaproteobacteria bacterium]
MQDYFLTMNKEGVFLGKDAAVTYRGEKLDAYHIQYAKRSFYIDSDGLVLKQPFAELYVMTSETSGLFSMGGTPSLNHGKHVWARAKTLGGTISGWTYFCECKNPSDAAKFAISSVLTGINLGVIFAKNKNQKGM